MARVFFAALPDADTRTLIAAAADAFELGTAVPPDDYHVTLAFVGEVPGELLAPLRQVGVSQRGRAFSLRFDTYEHWPKARVLVVAATEIPGSLHRLWEALHADLAKHNIALVAQPLRPHVTIARKVSQPPVLPALRPIAWSTRKFHLMQSTASGATSRYTVIDTWPLLDDGTAR